MALLRLRPSQTTVLFDTIDHAVSTQRLSGVPQSLSLHVTTYDAFNRPKQGDPAPVSPSPSLLPAPTAQRASSTLHRAQMARSSASAPF